MNKSFLTISLILIFQIASEVNGQDRKSGPSFGFGLGFGYSKHASTYLLERSGSAGAGQFKDHAGVRLLPMKFRAGWIFAQRILVAYNFILSPPNNTVSPYKSYYHGFGINYFPKSIRKLNFGASYGQSWISDRLTSLGKGNLLELSVGFEPDPHFLIELNTMFGRMNNNIEPNTRERQLGTNSEFFLSATVGYLFYRKTKPE